jgi:sodium-dependent dicarboxylate transporter 2/3/5
MTHTQVAADETPSAVSRIGLVAGPIVALSVYFLLPGGDAGLSHAARACGGVAALMAVWWMTEALPLEATALLPLVLLPLTGIYSSRIEAGDVVVVRGKGLDAIVERVHGTEADLVVARENHTFWQTDVPLSDLAKDSPFKRAAAPFADPSIFLFLGGFLIALAIEKWGLHRRIALLTVLAVGTRPASLVGGFMLATALVSMWISNTATTVMMLPIGLSVVALLQSRMMGTSDLAAPNATEGAAYSADATNFATCLLLGIAYAASLGGFATLIGTPPNVFFKGYMEGRGTPIDFGRWMLFAAPLSAIYLLLAWWLMTRVLFPVRPTTFPADGS